MELSIGTSNLKISVEFMFMFEVFGTAMKWWIFFMRAEWARSNSFACVRVEVLVKVAWLLLIWTEGNAIYYHMTLYMTYIVWSLAAQGLARQGPRTLWSCKQLCCNPILIYEHVRWSFFLQFKESPFSCLWKCLSRHSPRVMCYLLSRFQWYTKPRSERRV